MKLWMRLVLLGVVMLLVIACTPFRILKVEGVSMEPTLRNGDTLLLDHLYWKAGGVKRGDIVVVRHGTEQWVKRLAAMPGDNIRIFRYSNERYARLYNLTSQSGDGRPRQRDELVEERQLPSDEIFVIGDNLGRSFDSTAQQAGAIKVRDIVGVVRKMNLDRRFPAPGAS